MKRFAFLLLLVCGCYNTPYPTAGSGETYEQWRFRMNTNYPGVTYDRAGYYRGGGNVYR